MLTRSLLLLLLFLCERLRWCVGRRERWAGARGRGAIRGRFCSALRTRVSRWSENLSPGLVVRGRWRSARGAPPRGYVSVGEEDKCWAGVVERS